MKNKIILIITYILVFFNSNLFSNEDNNVLKIGLLAPLSGEYKNLGDSLLYSLQLYNDLYAYWPRSYWIHLNSLLAIFKVKYGSLWDYYQLLLIN